MTYGQVRERQAMLAGMMPVLKSGRYFFCTSDVSSVLAAVSDRSLATFREDEGTTLVLTEEDAALHHFDLSMPMSRIVLTVLSALDGVGLTAGVATALADEGIPCNMIAAYHHDHVFVPEQLALRAIEILRDLQRRASATQQL
jgi:uncharacterized protein